MSVKLSDVYFWGCALHPEDDVTVAIGGDVDRTVAIEFIDVGGPIQVVSSNAGDTTQTVTVTRRTAGGAIATEGKQLNGQTPVAYTNDPERLEKAVKGATCAGDVAVEAQTATHTGTAQAGSADDITLAAGASGVNQAYLAMIARITAGTGAGQIRRVIDYDGTTKKAIVDRPWATNPDNTSVVRLSTGFYLHKAPVEVMTARRLHINAGADVPGGTDRKSYDLIYVEDRHATLDCLLAKVQELSDPTAKMAFGLAAATGNAGTNGGGNNRYVAPAGVTFDSADKAVPGGSLVAGAYLGIWTEETLLAGQVAIKPSYVLGLLFSTV